jgi:hypothetical protein
MCKEHFPQPVDGCCSECGGDDLLLARDQTEYSSVVWVDGKFAIESSYVENTDAHDSIRLFCTGCGT